MNIFNKVFVSHEKFAFHLHTKKKERSYFLEKSNICRWKMKQYYSLLSNEKQRISKKEMNMGKIDC